MKDLLEFILSKWGPTLLYMHDSGENSFYFTVHMVVIACNIGNRVIVGSYSLSIIKYLLIFRIEIVIMLNVRLSNVRLL
jgi:hypothetical protein